MVRWYEEETPIEAVTASGELRFYPNAQKLQLSQGKWSDADGILHHGKTVTVPLGPFIGNAAFRAVLTAVLETVGG